MSSKIKIFVALDTITSKNLGCQLVSAQIRKIMSNSPEVGEVYYSKGFTYSLCPADKAKLKESDVVYVNGEGACGMIMTPLIKDILDTAIHHKKPIYFCNFTLDLRTRESIFVDEGCLYSWLNYFHLCEVVSVRDPISYYFLKEHGLDKVLLFPDIGTYHSPEENIKAEKESRQVMFSLGSIIKQIKPGLEKDKFLIGFQKIVNEISREYEVVIPDWPSSPVSDANFLSSIKNVKIIKPDYKEYFLECSKSIFNITGRHHGTVMSYSAGCPFLTFSSNMWKTEGDNFLYNSSPFLNIGDLRNNPKEWIDIIKDELLKTGERKLFLEKRKEVLKKYHAANVEIIWKDIPQMDISFLETDKIKAWLKSNYKLTNLVKKY